MTTEKTLPTAAESAARRAFLGNGQGVEFFFSHCGETWGVSKEFGVIVSKKDGKLSTTFLCPTCGEPMTVTKERADA